MDHFASQPDEGYSEDPLNPLTTFSVKIRDDLRVGAEFSGWLTRHINHLSVSDKTELAMALLNDLPTSVVSQIVYNLSPRLYIDFIRYLPPEICLKILGYLDPVSLIKVASSCRAWYELAIDRKLWEHLYLLEGWKVHQSEIELWEKKVNSDESPQTTGPVSQIEQDEDGHANKKRAISMSPAVELDHDLVMVDAEGTIKQEPAAMDGADASIFGGKASASSTGVSQRMRDLDVHSSGSTSGGKGKSIDKGKGRALSRSPEPIEYQALAQELISPLSQTKSALWSWDGTDKRFKINWKYLYTMRRRLESNWELGKYVNFQFPHPDFPTEGHSECVYSLQYNPRYLVSGSRDRTIKIWNMKTRRLIRTLAKHRGSVLCLQFDSDPDEDIIVSGSSDSDVIIWQFSTGRDLQVLRHAHRESVLNVKFDNKILVTCSKDKTVKIFNRKPLHYGEPGYQEVDPVPRTIDYAYTLNRSPEDLPVTPAWTMIGSLEGHGAAVNAVQIHGRQVVSASGDRHIKVWDWPSQVCTRTIFGHSKGIACVQYDGRRIVSGSSDNEIKVFDQQTGVEVASLRGHSDLVRTVQAGFGDTPYSAEEDAAEAKRVDQEYFKAIQSGLLDDQDLNRRRGGRSGNAGSKRPEDITAFGAALPPGGGGGKYGRIVSGSYDTSIIIWRRDKEGIWKDQHHLKQEEAAAQAFRRHGGFRNAPPGTIPLHPSMRSGTQAATVAAPDASGPSTTLATAQAAGAGRTAGAGSSSSAASTAAGPTHDRAQGQSSSSAGPSARTHASNDASPGQSVAPAHGHVQSSLFPPLTPQAIRSYRQMIDIAVPNGAVALSQALASYPAILSQRAYLSEVIDREPNPLVRSQLRQTVAPALIRTQFEQARQRREALRNLEQNSGGNNGGEGSSTAAGSADAASNQNQPNPADGSAPTAVAAPSGGTGAGAHQMAAISAARHREAREQLQAHAQARFLAHAHPGAHLHQLQFDARRIICCSQTSIIVGWDFCNDDTELEEASRFFAALQ